MIDLDHNATTTVLPEVFQTMTPDTGASRQMIRFSLGMENIMQEVEAAIAAVQRAVSALKG